MQSDKSRIDDMTAEQMLNQLEYSNFSLRRIQF